jgi:hypothetical protein
VIVHLVTPQGPIAVDASQLLVMNNEGTPIMVAGEYGAPGFQSVSKVGDDDFEKTLEVFGFGRHEIVVEKLKTPPVPAGATLIKP